MIPKKVKEHLEEYINQEVYVQIAIIKGKEKVSTHLAINKYFNSNHFKDLSNGKPYDHFIDGLKDKCLGKLKNSPMRVRMHIFMRVFFHGQSGEVMIGKFWCLH